MAVGWIYHDRYILLLPIVVGLSINLETCEARWKHTNTFAIEIRNGILIGLMCVLILHMPFGGGNLT